MKHVDEHDLQRALGAAGIDAMHAIWEASDRYRTIPAGFADRYAELRKGDVAPDSAVMTVRGEAAALLSGSGDGAPGSADAAAAI